MIAAREGHHECLLILLAHGAEVNKGGEVSIRGVYSIAYLLGVALLLKGCVVTFFASAVNYRLSTQLSWWLLQRDNMNACLFC